MDINIVDILNTGVTGFAFLMLYLGFKLTSDVQSKIFEQRPESFHDIEMYREWKSLVCSQINNTRYFLGFSLIFFIGGILLLMYQAESKIILSISPPEQPYKPLVFHQSEKIDLNETGRATVSVKNEQNISIDINEVINKNIELGKNLKSQEETIKKLAITNANTSSDSGF